MCSPSPLRTTGRSVAPGTLLLGLLATAPAAAQLREVGLYPDATQFSSRSVLAATSSGDVMVRLPRNVLVGVGNPGGAIQGLRAVIQDQDLGTSEPFQFVVLAGGGPDGPVTTPGQELLRTPDLTLPSGEGLGAVEVSITLATPLALPEDDYYLGIGLGTAPQWPLDGLSLHGSNYAGPAHIDDPAVPGLVTTYDRTLDRLIAGQRRVHAVHLMTSEVALRIGAEVDPATRRGAPNPNFGVRGAWQDRSSDDGLAVRVDAPAQPGTDVVVLGQLGGATAPYRVAGLDGQMFLNPALVFPDLVAMGRTDATGRFEAIALAWPLRLPAPFQLISLQAVVDPLGTARVSNLAAVRD